MKNYVPYTTRPKNGTASTSKTLARHGHAVRLTRRSRASRFPALRFRGALVAFGHSIVFESRLDLMAAYLIQNLPGIVPQIAPLVPTSDSVPVLDTPTEYLITTDELAWMLETWVVDIYQNTPHQGLNGKTPRQAYSSTVTHS